MDAASDASKRDFTDRSGLPARSYFSAGMLEEEKDLLFDDSDRAEQETAAEVTNTSYYGDMTYCGVALPGGGDPVTISIRNTAGRSVVPVGSPVRVGWGTESIVLFE